MNIDLGTSNEKYLCEINCIIIFQAYSCAWAKTYDRLWVTVESECKDAFNSMLKDIVNED